jgi:L-ribulokinase
VSEAAEYVVGVDFGTLSGRAVVVRVSDGAELADAVVEYAHGVLDDALPDGTGLAADWALQVPEDYREVLRVAVPKAVQDAGVAPNEVVGIATDFTACTMVPTLEDGTPLNEVPGLEDRPHAYVKLWKHHAAQPQADRINRVAEERDEAWLGRYGGLISSEWEFAKGLQIFEEDREVYDRMEHWVEAADWIVWQLCGSYVRNACSAGYKGILQEGHYPSPEFMEDLAEGFGGFVKDKLEQPVGQLGDRAGGLSSEAARWTGLPEGIAVAVGNVDAHVTSAAVNALDPGQMVAIMGTSTCQVMNAEDLREVPGMCGVVDGGIVEGLFGYEAGQSGVGDIFAWFTENCVPESYTAAAREAGESVHEHLTRLAAAKAVGQHRLVALDWHSGNRSVLVDHQLSGLVVGLTLTTPPEDIYRALLESTAFGMRVIVEAFGAAGVPVEDLVVAGGLTRNTFLMQIYSDVLRMSLSVAGSAQAPALGSAIHAAAAAGCYPDVPAAAAAMGRVDRDAYLPDEQRAAAYDELFAIYQELHDHFGRETSLMRRLKAL